MTVTDAPPEKRPARRRAALSVLLCLFVAPGALWLVGRLFGLERGLLIALFAATPYVAVATVLPLLTALLARRWRIAAVAGLVVLGMAACVLPRAVPDLDKGPTTGVALRVLTLNTLYGQADMAELVRLVRDDDVAVLAVQEFTPRGEAALKAAGIATLLPYQQVTAATDAGGSGLYSRYPIQSAATRRNVGGFQQATGTIQPPGAGPVHLESVHPLAPVGPRMYADWAADISNQPHADAGAAPRILLGDFNATLDHKELRDLIATGYRDAADAVGEGLARTWPSHRGGSGIVTIDHVLVDERIGVRAVSVHTVPGSDHRAVLASLTIPAG